MAKRMSPTEKAANQYGGPQMRKSIFSCFETILQIWETTTTAKQIKIATVVTH